MRTLITAVAVVAAMQTPASAEPLPEGSADHYAGSEIAKHEGWDRADVDPPLDGKVPGMDVSSHQKDVNWQDSWNKGARFAYIKATEGVTYKNPFFAQQYNGSYEVGMIRGAYHFALPDRADGVAQANHFVDNGGGWSADGKTLPPALDMEYNPYGETCYGMNQELMTKWVVEFSNRVFERTKRYPMIYTSTSWWNKCVGGSVKFGDNNPLWVARYGDHLDHPGALPAGFEFHTIWQWKAAGLFPGDQNIFNGKADQLLRIATG
ncbi:lysozyme [Lentzea sp. NBRC 105346]|uniref:lysozyme n=1 Tax=Lentzea sp. NBRC 105346 TaxID=3032205 RepID=UPI0024A3764E|nr:lysozyme [Lentzea sp. NBRC 105346]GLZ33301.1 lysozyme [Lentzea sp. NBRC 105346]